MMTLVPFILYACALIAAGYYGSLRNKSLSASGDRRAGLSYAVTAISAHASDMSAWLFLGFPAAIYRNGFDVCWIAVGLLLGMWLSWQFVAPRLRALSEQYGVLTLSGLLSKHFNDEHGLIRYASGITALFFFTFYIASGLKGVATLLEPTTGLTPFISISACAILTLTYALIGGYSGVVYVDFFQGIFLIVMIMIIPITILGHLPAGSLVTAFAQTSGSGTSLSLSAIIITMMNWGLGYFGIPHVLTKFMTIDKPEMLKRAQYVGMTWQTLALGAAAAIGVFGQILYRNSDIVISNETFFISLITEFFSPFMVGALICGVLSATLSTLDAQLIIAGNMLSEDVFRIHSQKTARLYPLILGTIIFTASVIALRSESYLHDIVNYAWSGLGSTFGPLVLATILPFRVSASAAFIGMLTGALVTALWPSYGLFLLDAPLIVGFTTNGIAMIVWSILGSSQGIAPHSQK